MNYRLRILKPFFFVMSYLLLDNYHHNHCCHGAYTETINQMMKTINQLQVKVDELSPKTWNGTVEFGGSDAKYRWVYNETLILDNDYGTNISAGSTMSSIVGSIDGNANPLWACVPNRITSHKISNLSRDVFDKIYNSTSATIRFKHSNLIDDYVLTKVFTRTNKNSIKTIQFISNSEWNVVNSGASRASLNINGDDCVLIWDTHRRNTMEIDEIIGDSNSISAFNITIVYQ